MSDFDKEAERERLREKYEEEQAEREATEKMSELLLQGATMTNAHCSDCGDPIFRYDGQEFCASCEKAVDRDTGEDGENAQDEENIEVTTPDDTQVAFGGENAQDEQPETADQSPQSPPAQRDQSPENGQPTQSTENARLNQPTESSQPGQAGGEQGEPRQSTPEQRQPATSGEPRQPARQSNQQTHDIRNADSTASGDVSAARDSLVRTLTRFSQQAEATDDPQRAREYLAAAREAAETLAVLRQ